MSQQVLPNNQEIVKCISASMTPEILLKLSAVRRPKQADTLIMMLDTFWASRNVSNGAAGRASNVAHSAEHSTQLGVAWWRGFNLLVTGGSATRPLVTIRELFVGVVGVGGVGGTRAERRLAG